MGAFRKDQTRPSAAPAPDRELPRDAETFAKLEELEGAASAPVDLEPFPLEPEPAPHVEPEPARVEAVSLPVVDDGAKEAVYLVAPGKGITSNRGILTAETAGPGLPGQVWPRDFLEDQKTVDDLVATGALVKS